MTDLSKNARSIQNALEEKGITAKVIELSASTRTAAEAAAAINCEVAQICKSLIFRTKTTKRPVLVLASGINRLNEKELSHQIEEPLEKADADFVRDVTGFAIGGVPPIGHNQKIELVFIDETLLKFDTVWAAAGTPHAVFSLPSKDLLKLTNGQVLSVPYFTGMI